MTVPFWIILQQDLRGEFMKEENLEKKERDVVIKVSKGLKEKIVLLAIGTIVTAFTFLLSDYTSGFVRAAEYNKDKNIWSNILVEIRYMREDIKELKKKLK